MLYVSQLLTIDHIPQLQVCECPLVSFASPVKMTATTVLHQVFHYALHTLFDTVSASDREMYSLKITSVYLEYRALVFVQHEINTIISGKEIKLTIVLLLYFITLQNHS